MAPSMKKQTVVNNKAWDHPILKKDWPSAITILSLVWDAAARLPDGVGTWADIC